MDAVNLDENTQYALPPSSQGVRTLFGLHTIEHALTPIVDRDLTLAIENMSRVNMVSRPDDVPRRVLRFC